MNQNQYVSVDWGEDQIDVASDIDLHDLGLDADSLEHGNSTWDDLWSSAKELASKELGYQCPADYLDHDNEPEQISLLQYDDYYIVSDWGEMTDGNGIPGSSSWLVTRNYNEAKKYYDSLKPFDNDPREEIKWAKSSELLQEYADDLWFDMKTCLYGDVLYNVKYRGFLIIEKAGSLNPQDVLGQIKRLNEFINMLRQHNIVLTALYKARREWNDNQRYYAFEFMRNGTEVDERGHIPSRMQGKTRFVLDYFKESWMKEIEQETAEDEPVPFQCPVCHDADGCEYDMITVNGAHSQRVPVQPEDTDADGRCVECGAKLGHFHHVCCSREKLPGSTLLLSQYWMIDQDDEPDIEYSSSSGGGSYDFTGYPGCC